MDKLKDMIALLKLADFDPTNIDTDLHERVADNKDVSYASCDSTLEWAFSDTTSVCWQSWKAYLMHQATITRLTRMSCVIVTLM